MVDLPQSNFSSMANFGAGEFSLGTPVQPTVSPQIAAKQAKVARAAEAKAFLMGGKEAMRVAATARIQGNDAGKTELMEDLAKFSKAEFVYKYGAEVASQVSNFDDAYRDVRALKGAERSGAVAAGDTALTAAQALLGMGGAAASVITQGQDNMSSLAETGINWAAGSDVLNIPRLTPVLAKGLDVADEFLQEQKSAITQERAVQHQIEGQLDNTDSEAQYRRDVANGASMAWARKQLRDAGNAVGNYADDPIMAGELATNAVASLVPFAGAAKVIGSTAALKTLIQKNLAKGMTRDAATTAAKATLKTPAGRKLIREKAAASVPMINAVVEGGSSITQAQQEILAMTENDLAESAQYVALRENGMSHEDAQIKLAQSAANTAGLIGGSTGYVTGLIAPGFEAAPFRLGSSKSAGAVAGGVLNVGKEGAEEFIQEGATALGVNAGVKLAGIDRQLDQGVAGAGATGALGGIMAAGATQAPVIAAGAVAETAKATGKALIGGAKIAATGAGNLADRRSAEISDDIDASSPVGTAAQAASAEVINEIVQADATETETPPSTGTPESIIQEERAAAAALSPEVEAEVVGFLPGLQALKEANPDKPITRHQLVNELSNLLSSADLPAEAKPAVSLMLLGERDKLMRMLSTKVTDAVEALGPDHAESMKVATIQTELNTMNSSPVIKQALGHVASMTVEDVTSQQGYRDLLAGNTETEDAKNTRETLGLLQIYNIGAIPADQVDLVLNQSPVGEDTYSKSIREGTKGIVTAIDDLREAAKEGDALVKTLPEQGKIATSWQRVHENVLTTGNQNNRLPSLAEHTRRIRGAIFRGDLEAAGDHLAMLANFIQSQNNKLGAYNESSKIKGGNNKVTFDVFNGKQFLPSEQGVFVRTNSRFSVMNAKYVQFETQSLATIYNFLAKEYAKAGGSTAISPVQVLALDADIIAAFPKDTPALRSKIESTIHANEAHQPKPNATKPVDSTPVETKPVTPEATPVPDVKEVIQDTPVEETVPVVTVDPIEALIKKYQDKLEGKTTSLEVDNSIKSLGLFRISTNTISLNIEAIVEDYNAGMTYIDGNGETSSIQKKVVFANVNVEAFKKFILSKGVETYIEFIIEHELEHVRQRARGDIYPKNLMDPISIALERAANEVAFKAIGFNPSTTPIVAVDPTKQLDLSVIMPTLVKLSTGASRLFEAFKSKKIATGMLVHDRPAQWLLNNINNLGGKDGVLGRDLTPEQIKTVEELIRSDLPAFAKSMNDLLTAKEEKAIASGNDAIFGYRNLLSLNLLHKNAEGKMEFEPHVVAAAFFSTYEWMTGIGNSVSPKMKKKHVARIFGVEESKITPEMWEALRFGRSQQSATMDIARTMITMLGLEKDTTASAAFTQGIFNAMAANALTVFEGGLIQHKITSINGKNYGGVRTSKAINVQQGIAPFKGMPDIFTRIFAPNAEKVRYVGTAPNSNRQTVKNNNNNELRKLTKKAIKTQESIPFTLNKVMFDLYAILGNDLSHTLLGVVETDKAKMNINDYEAAESRNASIKRDLEGAQGYLQEATEFAGPDGKAEDVSVYFAYEQTSTGRLMQQGPVTPQANKITRSLMTATNAVVDLTDPEANKWFMLTVAQNIGISVDKQLHEDSLSQVEDMFSSKTGLAEAVLMAQDWLNDPTSASPAQKKAFVESIRSAKDAEGAALEVTANLAHAVMTMARANNALLTGGEARSKFATSLSLEVDGVADGPTNASIHMSTGAFTVTQIMAMQRGGVSFDPNNTTINEFLAGGGQDIYNSASTLLKNKIEYRLKNSSETEKKSFLALLRVMNALLPGFSITEDLQSSNDVIDDVIDDESENPLDITIDRKVTKNPLTVFIYGSGVSGIAGKLLSTMQDSLYGEITKILEQGATSSAEVDLFNDHPTLLNDLNEMMGTKYVRVNGGWAAKPNKQQNIHTMLRNDMANLTLSPGSVENMISSIESFLGDDISDSIDIATGRLSVNMEVAQNAANLQTLVFQTVVERLLATAQSKRQAAHDAKYKGKPGSPKYALPLSEKEMSDLMKEALVIAPIYETEGQDFHISDGEKVDGDQEVARGLSGKFKTFTSVPNPSDAGRKVAPYMVIGTGDGRMILNIYARQDGSFDTTLQVFDGVELSADMIPTGAKEVNKAVYDGWIQGNIFQSMAESYARLIPFLETSKALEGLTPDAKIRMKTLIWGPDTTMWGNLEPVLFADIWDELQEKANESTARKQALKETKMWVDHMASAMSPHETEGSAIIAADPSSGPTPQEIADHMNVVYNRVLAEQKKAKSVEATTPSIGSEATVEFRKRLKDFGDNPYTDLGVDVLQISGANIGKFLKSAKFKGMSKDQRSVLFALTADNDFEDTKFIFGSAEDLTKIRDAKFPELDKKRIQYGRYYPGAKLALITKTSPDTVLHELIHARLADTLRAYYLDPDKAPEHVKAAVKRLERMMSTFTKMDFSLETPKTREAGQHVQRILAGFSQADKESRVHEFVAYMLTTQDVADIGKRTRIYSPLAKLAKQVIYEIQKLLKISHLVKPGNDMFSNVLFNMQVATAIAPDVEIALTETQTKLILNQSFGHNASLDTLEEKFLNKLQTFLAARTTTSQATSATLLARSEAAANNAVANGFTMDPREIEVFKAIHATLFSGMVLDPTALKKAQEIHGHAVKTLTLKDFLADQTTASHTERVLAKKQHELLASGQGALVGADGKSDLLATFFALSQINPDMQAALRKMDLPKAVKDKTGGVDAWLTGAANTSINHLVNLSLSGKNLGKTAESQLAGLAHVLTEVETKRRWIGTEQLGKKVDAGNAYVKDKITVGAEAAVKKLNEVHDKIKTKPENLLNNSAALGVTAARLLASVGSAKELEAQGHALTGILNLTDGYATVRETLADLRGITKSTLESSRLINRAKGAIDKVRQNFREDIPKILRGAFSRKLTKAEWANLFDGVARSDILALGRSDATDLLKDPSRLAAAISQEEATMSSLAGSTVAPKYKAKAQALADYMITRENKSNRLLRNADAIADLTVPGTDPLTLPAGLVKSIDKLISLYAFQKTDEATRTAIAELMDSEPEGMKLLIGYQHASKLMEAQRLGAGVRSTSAHYNGWKGYVPSAVQSDAAIRIADDSENADLVLRGYVRVGDYEGDPNESYSGRRGLYFTNVSQRNQFRQGVAQTVHGTYQGVDTKTGFTHSHEVSGAVVGRDMLKAKRNIARNYNGQDADNLPVGEHLMPVFNEKGEIVAYERPISPEHTSTLKASKDLALMLGVWSGRNVEESLSTDLNKDLVEVLFDVHANHVGDPREFVNLADPGLKDPVLKDIWNTLGWQIKDDIEEKFGRPDYFPVRRDMVNDMVGVRSASFTDPWTGVSRLSPKVQKAIRDVATITMGKNAYKYSSIAYAGITEYVSIAKTNIVVRSVVVITGNAVSNVLHLATWGINPLTIAKKSKDKFIELTNYQNNQTEITNLNVRLSAEFADPVKVKRLRAQIQLLEDANKNMSISPLIDAYEFTTISEGLTEDDLAIREGRMVERFERLMDKAHIPEGVRSAGKQLAITKDTAVFKGLNRALQYGDFLAKGVLYDHLIENKNMSKQAALDIIAEEFVNYNKQAGRGREFLESVGLLWFYNYKLRITKIAMNTLRDRPLTALFYLGGVGPMFDIDTVVSSSLPGSAISGSASFSVGAEMGLNAWTLHPLHNLLN